MLALGTAEAWGFWSSTSAHVSGQGAGTMGQPCHEFPLGRWGCSYGSLPGDLWEQESGINGFAESLTLGIILEGWCRAGDVQGVGEHRGQRWGAGAGAGRGGVGWLRYCTTTALESLGYCRRACSPQGSRQGLGAAWPRCRSPVLQLHRATRKTHPSCSPVGRAGSALVELLPLPCPPSPWLGAAAAPPGCPQPHRKGSVLTLPWGRAQAAGQRRRLCKDRQLKKEVWFN